VSLKSTIIVYCKTNAAQFERTFPLAFLAKRNQALGYSNDIHVLVTDGYERLGPAYIDSLSTLGYHLHDVASLYREERRRFPGLQDLQLTRDGFTFIRWPVLARFFAGESFVHYDGDVVFNEDPAILEDIVAGHTFVLQGCPALTVVSDESWLDSYTSHLREFSRKPQDYMRRARSERDGWNVTFRTRWAGCWFESQFVGDQAFISHLIHTGGIHQDQIEPVMLKLRSYAVFENPLYAHVYEEMTPYSYGREAGVDYFHCTDGDGVIKKRVLIWHWQSYFASYAAKYLLRRKLLGALTPRLRVQFELGRDSLEDRIAVRVNSAIGQGSRLVLYKYFYERADFSGLLRDGVWWKQGVFS
jgi:hypothetical protein